MHSATPYGAAQPAERGTFHRVQWHEPIAREYIARTAISRSPCFSVIGLGARRHWSPQHAKGFPGYLLAVHSPPTAARPRRITRFRVDADRKTSAAYAFLRQGDCDSPRFLPRGTMAWIAGSSPWEKHRPCWAVVVTLGEIGGVVTQFTTSVTTGHRLGIARPPFVVL